MNQLVPRQRLNASTFSFSQTGSQLRSALVFCFLTSILSLHAQSTFTVSPSPVFSVEVDDGADAIALITNHSTTTDTFLWQRQIIQFDDGTVCELGLADPFQHYLLELTAQKTFWLQPGQSGPLYVELYDFNGEGCCALVHLKITKVGSPADTVTVVYHLRECQAVGTVDLVHEGVQIFPNPVQDVFSLKNAGDVSAMRVFDAQGRMVGRFEANDAHTYSLQYFSAGTYFIALEDPYGRVFQVAPIQKKG